MQTLPPSIVIVLLVLVILLVPYTTVSIVIAKMIHNLVYTVGARTILTYKVYTNGYSLKVVEKQHLVAKTHIYQYVKGYLTYLSNWDREVQRVYPDKYRPLVCSVTVRYNKYCNKIMESDTFATLTLIEQSGYKASSTIEVAKVQEYLCDPGRILGARENIVPSTFCNGKYGRLNTVEISTEELCSLFTEIAINVKSVKGRVGFPGEISYFNIVFSRDKQKVTLKVTTTVGFFTYAIAIHNIEGNTNEYYT